MSDPPPYIKSSQTPFSADHYLSPEDIEHIAEPHTSPKTDRPRSPYSAEDYISPRDIEHIAEDYTHHATDNSKTDDPSNNSKADDPLLHQELSQNSDRKDSTTRISFPSKSTSTFDEEKNTTKPRSSRLNPKERHKRALDLAQRVASFIVSLIILIIMTRAYITFLKNKNVTAGGEAIYPTFMNLWPTYLMITAAAVTVTLNGCVVYWRVRGTIKDLHRQEIFSKYWDYGLHGVNILIWLGTSSIFAGTKEMGGAKDPNVLWGYVCSDTAKELNAKYPEILKFFVQCEVQSVSFWMSVSEILLEAFTLATKLFVKLGVV